MTLLLMAAGRGSRYGKLKQFDTLGPQGEFLMEFSIKDAIQSGFKHIVIITQAENVQFVKDHMEKRIPKNIKLDVIAQRISELPVGLHAPETREKPWGTAHAVWCARKVIKSSFAVINADDYYGSGVYGKVINALKKQSNPEYILVGYSLKDTLSTYGPVSRGVCEIDSEMKLKSVVECFKLESQQNQVIELETGSTFTGDEMVSMNFWVCQPEMFNYIEEELSHFFTDPENVAKSEVYLPKVIQKLLQQGQIEVNVLPSKSNWFGVTYAQDRAAAVEKLADMTKKGTYSTPLW